MIRSWRFGSAENSLQSTRPHEQTAKAKAKHIRFDQTKHLFITEPTRKSRSERTN